jgi:hypothetical protein
VFLCQKRPKDVKIKETLESNVPMRAGKFLVPEYNKYLGLAIDDLKRLNPLFDAMGDKHSYEKIIYDAYIKNNDFILTDKQRQEAYEEYKV